MINQRDVKECIVIENNLKRLYCTKCNKETNHLLIEQIIRVYSGKDYINGSLTCSACCSNSHWQYEVQ